MPTCLRSMPTCSASQAMFLYTSILAKHGVIWHFRAFRLIVLPTVLHIEDFFFDRLIRAPWKWGKVLSDAVSRLSNSGTIFGFSFGIVMPQRTELSQTRNENMPKRSELKLKKVSVVSS